MDLVIEHVPRKVDLYINLNVDVSKGTLLKDEVVAERLVIGIKQ